MLCTFENLKNKKIDKEGKSPLYRTLLDEQKHEYKEQGYLSNLVYSNMLKEYPSQWLYSSIEIPILEEDSDDVNLA